MEKLRSCVLEVSPGLGVSLRDLDRDGGGHVSDVEAVQFYFANDDARVLCFEEVGLRHPSSFLAHADAEKKYAELVRSSMASRANFVKSEIAKERSELQESLMQDLKVYYQLSFNHDDGPSREAVSLIMKAGRMIEKANGNKDEESEQLPSGMVTYENVIAMPRDERIAGHESSVAMLNYFRGRIEKKIRELAKVTTGTDVYYAYLAEKLGRHLRKIGYGVRHNLGKAEYTGLQSIKEGRGSCTEYAYVLYMFCRVAGVPKEKLRVVAEWDVGEMEGQRVGHMSLAVRVPKYFRKSGYYYVDFVKNRYDKLPPKGEIGNANGLVAMYLGSKSAVLSNKGKHWTSYRLARMAASLWPSKMTYRFLVSSLEDAMESGIRLLSISGLKELKREVRRVCSSDSEILGALIALIDYRYSLGMD